MIIELGKVGAVAIACLIAYCAGYRKAAQHVRQQYVRAKGLYLETERREAQLRQIDEYDRAKGLDVVPIDRPMSAWHREDYRR